MKSGFLTALKVELVDDLANDGQGEWELLAALVYIDGKGVTHVVPSGFSCDFASVPRAPFAYWLTGNTAHRPAVLHDYYCRTGLVPRERADELFYEAMDSVGMPKWRAGMMYAAVAAYTRALWEKVRGRTGTK